MRGNILAACAVLFLSASVEAQDEEEDPLAELAALGDAMAEETPEGGGSIRAKREVDPEIAKRLKDPRNVQAKVEMVRSGKFPAVALKLKVTRPAKEGPGKDIAKNTSVVVIPKLKVDAGKVALKDPETLLNAGAFYLQRGDKVVVRFGGKKKKVWEAEYIERK